jgi:hypothetical protein
VTSRRTICFILGPFGKSALCHKRHTQRSKLVSIRSPRRQWRAARKGNAECPGGAEVDDQLELGRLLDRHVSRLFAFQDAAHIDAGQLTPIGDVSRGSDAPAISGQTKLAILRASRETEPINPRAHRPPPTRLQRSSRVISYWGRRGPRQREPNRRRQCQAP